MYLAARLKTGDLWWKNALLYCLDVETYFDSDGDGVGDFVGLTQRLDYLASLGVTCLWLLPFYPTPNRDDGYDVTDFYNVDERLGSLGDFVTFRRAAGDRGIRVVIDLVVNHTSDEHPWFRSARADRNSPFRDWYVWADEPVGGAEHVIFPPEQKGNWSYDEQAGQHYFHRFYDFQPDLNFSNEKVREEIFKVMGFWLEMGVSGFRIDAAPFIIETVGVHGDASAHHHEWLRDMHAFVTRRKGDAVLIGEANIAPEAMADYFGDGEEVHLLFNYSQAAATIYGLATQQAEGLRRHLQALPEAPEVCGWLNFARIHDELNLERLAGTERKEVFEAFAPEEHLRLYDRGLRRRLPPLLDGDLRRVQLAYSLAFSLPGMPMLLYGEEIGMGDNLSLPGRLSVRTPMQWSAERNGGFSVADPDDLVRPLVDDPDFDYERVNVARQRHDAESLLRWMRRLIEVRRETAEVGLGEWELLESGHDDVLVHRCWWEDEHLVALHNLSEESRTVEVPELEGLERLAVVFGQGDADKELEQPARVDLGPYGYTWLRATMGEDRSLL